MVSVVFDAGELDEVVARAVSAAIERIDSRRPKEAEKVLLTKREAAEAMGVSPATLDRLRAKGLPAVKLDGLVLFRPEALRSWAAEQESLSSGG